jgi:hypothetical protein
MSVGYALLISHAPNSKPPRDLKQEIVPMSFETTRLGREPAGRAAQLAQDDEPAKIQIFHDVTSDCDEPWPPPGSDLLWVILRRAKGRTLWRAIHLA